MKMFRVRGELRVKIAGQDRYRHFLVDSETRAETPAHAAETAAQDVLLARLTPEEPVTCLRWSWREVREVPEDVLMRRLDAPTLPGLP